ncbi:MAG: hypothetical protein SNJ71_07595 [Bacteroidales bacterium]
MSHFYVGVILPKNIPETQIENTVEKLLSPYDCNLICEEREVACWCLNAIAKQEALKVAKEKVGDLHELRLNFNIDVKLKFMNELAKKEGDSNLFRNLTSSENEYIENIWKSIRAKYDEVFNSVLDNHKLKDKPNPDCVMCNGKGKIITTHNEFGKWDWYVIGGSYNGLITNTDTNTRINCLELNISSVSSFLKVCYYLKNNKQINYIIPDVIVTPDGYWYEKPQYTQFDLLDSYCEPYKYTWELDVIKLLSSLYKKHWIVGVDCHY